VADLGALASEASTCPRCDLALTRTQVVFGDGDPGADLLLVGEGPGADEDRLGVPFVGRSGQLLTRLVEEEVGIGRDRCYTTNIVKCRPPGNRDPKPHEAAACAPWLEGQLDLIAPRVVVTFGNVATRRLLGTKEGITALRGRTHPWRGVTLVPTFHPAAALRGGPATVAAMREDLGRARLALERGRPEGRAGGREQGP
jgi:DNA polymerase